MNLLRIVPKQVQRLLPLLLLLLVANHIGFCSHRDKQQGERYASLVDLEHQQRESGFVKIGRFGSDWPARVVEITTSRDQISFTRQNGTRHSYTGFEGFTLKMIRLLGRNGEVIVVFRSVAGAPTDQKILPPRSGESPVRVL